MPEERVAATRLFAYSDAVFAVIVTIMVLELRAPEQPAFSALRPLWPTAISYAVSYLFIAIIWINHDHLMRFVGPPTQKLVWLNFVHLFLCRSYRLRLRGLRVPDSRRPPWCAMQVCSCVSISLITFLRMQYTAERIIHSFLIVRGRLRDADRSRSLRSSRLRCSWRSSLRVSVLV